MENIQWRKKKKKKICTQKTCMHTHNFSVPYMHFLLFFSFFRSRVTLFCSCARLRLLLSLLCITVTSTQWICLVYFIFPLLAMGECMSVCSMARAQFCARIAHRVRLHNIIIPDKNQNWKKKKTNCWPQPTVNCICMTALSIMRACNVVAFSCCVAFIWSRYICLGWAWFERRTS